MSYSANKQVSSTGDLASLTEELEAVLAKYFDGRPEMVIAFTAPPDPKVHWLTNVSRRRSVSMLESVATRMVY